MRGKSQGGREPHLGEKKRGSEHEQREERVDSTVNEGRLQGGKGRASKKSLPRRGRRKHEQVSGRKSSLGRCAESWCHSKSGQN